MVRTNSTVIILLISLFALCITCFKAKPLLTGRYDREPGKFLAEVSKSNLGKIFINNYWSQLSFYKKQKTGPYKNLDPANKPAETNFHLARLIFTGFVALFAFLVSLAVFIINAAKKQMPTSMGTPKAKLVFILLLIILNGTIIRLILASSCYGNFDMQSWDIVADIAAKGGNVYVETHRYTTSPVWFTILGTLKKIQLQFPAIPFHFVVRAFLSAVDLVILAFLLLIARLEKISMTKTAVFFYLNPVSFLTTGYHGQFENLAVVMVVIGIFAYFALKTRPVLGKALLWVFASAGMIAKHNIFYEVIICLHFSIKRYWLKFSLFVISCCIFLGLFLPYWRTGSDAIIEHVFKYSSGVGYYGITSLINLRALKYVFILGMLVFPLFLKGKDIVRHCLLGMLFFLAFTTGMASQYTVLPLAFGALRPSKGFLIYSLVSSVFVLGYGANVYLPGFNMFRMNLVWVAAVGWFLVELYNDRKSGQTVTADKQKTPVFGPTKIRRKK